MDGRTSTEIHRCDLVERHRISARVSLDDAPATIKALSGQAHDWCDAHELDAAIKVAKFAQGSEAVTITAEWDVTIGKGVIDPNQGVPGVLDSWTWSGRVGYWRRFFGYFEGGRQGRILAQREDGLASVTKLRRSPFAEPVPPEIAENPLLPPTVGQTPPWSDPTRYDK